MSQGPYHGPRNVLLIRYCSYLLIFISKYKTLTVYAIVGDHNLKGQVPLGHITITSEFTGMLSGCDKNNNVDFFRTRYKFLPVGTLSNVNKRCLVDVGGISPLA